MLIGHLRLIFGETSFKLLLIKKPTAFLLSMFTSLCILDTLIREVKFNVVSKSVGRLLKFSPDNSFVEQNSSILIKNIFLFVFLVFSATSKKLLFHSKLECLQLHFPPGVLSCLPHSAIAF